jgi:hypothetical protein
MDCVLTLIVGIVYCLNVYWSHFPQETIRTNSACRVPQVWATKEMNVFVLQDGAAKMGQRIQADSKVNVCFPATDICEGLSLKTEG